VTDRWSPTWPVDRALAERLIAGQFPQLDITTLLSVGHGWDHRVWRCEDVLFRFPHQPSALTVGRDRADALRDLAPLLPLAIPSPVCVGLPTTEYPGHFVGYRWIDGDLPARLPLTTDDRARAAPVLAGFTRALHALPRDRAAAWQLPDAEPRGTMEERTVNGRLRAEQLKDSPFAGLARRAAEAMDPPPPECTEAEKLLVHGDLHAGQVLFDDAHALVGVIDWDSLEVGDPAFDLLMAFSFVPPRARAAFWDAYGPSTAVGRARHLALSYGLALLAQGVATGDAGVRDEAAFSLENALG